MFRQLVTLSNNQNLPEISAWKVKSFWLQLLLVATIVLNYLGIDLTAVLKEMGLGASPEEVVATGQRAIGAFQEVILPVLLGVWMWFERRAPSFRLRILPKVKDVFDWGVGAIILLLAVGLTVGAAQAQSQNCANAVVVREMLAERYGEVVIGQGIAADGQLVEIWANALNGSWTVVVTKGHLSCLGASGQDWQTISGASHKGEPT